MSVLKGIKIIDFGHYIAGPMVGMLLADQGADVVKIDPPSGPRFDSPANAVWNRGKRLLGLDLKSKDDLDTAKSLIAGADVVIENFRPGVMDRLGLGASAMAELNPGLIYCSLPGFNGGDPRSDMPAWEGVVSSASALYGPSIEGAGDFGPELLGVPITANESAAGNPVYSAVPVASSIAAFLATTTISMSLLGRERDGRGEKVEVSLFDAMYGVFSLFGMKIMSMGAHAFYLTAWSRQYRCADGRWLMLQINDSHHIRQFVERLDLKSWAERGLDQKTDDPEICRLLLAELTTLMASKTAEQWQEKISEIGLCASICNSNREWLHHAHAMDSRMVEIVNDSKLGSMIQPGIQVQLSATPGEIRGPAETAEAKALIDEYAKGKKGAAENKAPIMNVLDGVKVIDLSIVLAGPTCGRLLVEFGADVVKIDDVAREDKGAYQFDVNPGKRSIHLNLKNEEDMDVLWKLIEEADVIVQGFRQGVAERLGIGYEQVKQKVPNIIYTSVNCYGDTGPWSARPGFEQLAQAATGMQMRFGGESPRLQNMPMNDYATGYMAAYATALALIERKKTGRGQHVQTALARTAMTFQSLYMHEYSDKDWSDIPSGQQALGDCANHRLYQASDGWFFLGSSSSAFQSMLRGKSFGLLQGEQDADLEAALEEIFIQNSIQYWQESLIAFDIAEHQLRTVEDSMNDKVAIEHGVSLIREHNVVGDVRTCGPSKRLCQVRPVCAGYPAVIQGVDSESVRENLWNI